MEYLLGIVVLVLVYGICATAENISLGYSGQFSSAQGALFGTGAYVFAFATNMSWPLIGVLPLVVVIGGFAGAAISYVGNRLRGDYFLIVTMAFQLIVVDVVRNLTSVTGGAQGMSGVFPLYVGAFLPRSRLDWVAVIAPFALVLFAAYLLIGSSRLGLVWKGIREDESATASLGRDPMRFKVLAFGISAAGMALSGALYGSFISYVSPGQFTMNFSMFVISALIVGGVANPFGPFAGVIFLEALTEGLRLIPNLPADVRAHLLQVIYAGCLLVFLALRPQGLIPEGSFRNLSVAGIRSRFARVREPLRQGRP